MENEEKIVFLRDFAHTDESFSGELKTVAGGFHRMAGRAIMANSSRPIPAQNAIDWLNEYISRAPQIFVLEGGQYKPVYGFAFDVSDIQSLIKDLNDDEHQLYVGFGVNSLNSHTLIVGAVEVTRDASKNVIDRTLIYNPMTPRQIYDYCNPCPPGNPTSAKPVNY